MFTHEYRAMLQRSEEEQIMLGKSIDSILAEARQLPGGVDSFHQQSGLAQGMY